MLYLAATVQPKDIQLIMRPRLHPSLILIVLIFSSTNAMSCSCIREHGSLEDQVTEAFSSASNVIWAKAESTQSVSLNPPETSINAQAIASNNPPQKQRTQFVAIKSWKGSHRKRFSTEVTTVCCVCGYRFVEGEEYLLYLYNGPNEEGYYRANICTRTKPIGSATNQELEILSKLSFTLNEKKRTPTCREMK